MEMHQVKIGAMIVFLLCVPALAAAVSYCDMAILDVTVESTTRGESAQETFRGIYGDHSPHSEVSGRVVLVASGSENKSTGCSADFHAVPNSTNNAKWIALMQRGECLFVDKIRNAVQVNGATAAIIYNQPRQNMTGIRHAESVAVVVQLSSEDGLAITRMLKERPQTVVTIRQEDPDNGSHLDPITIIVSACLTLIALVLNATALVAICCKTKKLKPHLYLVINLIWADLLIAVVGAVQVAIMYEGLHDPCTKSANKSTARCASAILSRIWNVLLYSNMFTLFLLTMEHFVACRWPFWHKIIVTRRKVTFCICICWVVSCIPDAVVFAMECDAATSQVSVGSDSGLGVICRYIDTVSLGNENWAVSAVLVSIVTTVLLTLIGVYGYILYLIHGASISNIEAKKKRNAIITSLLFLFSFVVSYVFFYVIHFSVAVERTADATILQDNRKFLESLFPTSGLIVDYMFTGVLGAILDPLIYCARTKEVKIFLLRTCTKKRNNRSSSAYATNSLGATTAEYSVVTAITEDEQL